MTAVTAHLDAQTMLMCNSILRTNILDPVRRFNGQHSYLLCPNHTPCTYVKVCVFVLVVDSVPFLGVGAPCNTTSLCTHPLQRRFRRCRCSATSKAEYTPFATEGQHHGLRQLLNYTYFYITTAEGHSTALHITVLSWRPSAMLKY